MTQYNGKTPTTQLEEELFKSVEKNTPDYIKNANLLDLTNKNSFIFKLKKEYLEPYNAQSNPEGLGLNNWLKDYEKEAKVSTAGIRGPQNILYPTDTRFPISLIGIMLATIAKALVAKENYPNQQIVKLAGREVRYNSDKMLDLIARIQAAQEIKTLVPQNRETIPIWLASFLAFKLDLLGGEYITSSHGISVKNATKDLNSQGSQYLPEESMQFVNKIKEIFEIAEKEGEYKIEISANDSEFIDEEVMTKLNNGVDLYVEYLKTSVANDLSIENIKGLNDKIVIESVGGSAYKTLSKVLEKLGIANKFDWQNTEEDAFFHAIGKYDHDAKGNLGFYDYSVDATVTAKKQDGTIFFPVIESLNYKEKLVDYPVNTAVLITDPDHDRLTVTQILDKKEIPYLNKLGIDYVELNDNRILAVFTANQAFLMLMDYNVQQQKQQGVFENYPRFIIKTTASALSWDEWANANNIKVVNVPVGFKEIANIMKKVEKQIKETPDKDVVITDVFNNDINLGKNPKVVFAGEESGGMIIGPEKIIESLNGRKAIAMREKSATEAILITSALVAQLEKDGKNLANYLENVFVTNKIKGQFDVRVDISYYNESESDIEKLKKSKIEGEAKRTKNDLFFLTLAIAKNDGVISFEQVKEILSSTFKSLNFSSLKDIKFVGDGTYLLFDNKFIEIRPSGTDAKTKAYGGGLDKSEITNYAQILGNYSGDLTDLYKQIVPMDLYENAKEISMNKYQEFTDKDANNEKFVIPNYNF